jgi:D-alanyl-D-alanine carboxypeptidase (penicillin-binding protein 5/6)
MSAWRRALAVVAGVVLAVPVTAATPASSSAVAEIPCPAAKPPKPVKRPPKPSPPPTHPALREVGGKALATAGLAAPAGAPAPPALTATSWLVADLDSGAVLGACGAHEYGTPASVQKLLLAATVLPRLDPDQVVTVNRADLTFEPGSSAVGLLLGGRYRVATLWLGLLLNSGNDAANVLARLGGGEAGVPGTVQAMNAEAERLGAFQTHAVTPSGLDGPGQFTSAYDLGLIARACFAYADFGRYARTERATVPAQPPRDKRGFQIQNQNQLIFRYPGALGGKTGFTSLARHTYVGAAERGGRRLVVTLLGAEARPLRGWQQGAALLDWGFSLPPDASVGRLVEPGEARRPAAPPPSRGEPRSPATPGPADAADPVSMTDSMAGAAAVLAAATPLVLLVALVRRRRARSRPGGHPAR